VFFFPVGTAWARCHVATTGSHWITGLKWTCAQPLGSGVMFAPPHASLHPPTQRTSKAENLADWILTRMHSVGLTLRSSPRTTCCLLTTCEQAHYIFPHDSELVASSMAGKSAQKSQRRRGQSRDIKTGQATHL